MKKSSTREEMVARKQMRTNVIVILICALAFIGICILTAYTLKHDEEQIIVHAKTKVPYDQITKQQTVYMQKTYNKEKDCWELFEVEFYSYQFDGIPGIFVTCDELGQSMDFYGFSDYEILTTYNKYDYGENSPENPSFNVKLIDMSGDKEGIYIHPEETIGTFLIVQ